ncbi:hypothetical protein FQN57_001958 [Myotisia sp. PD_48]|nr:hypothetical protein FQN57_001958 [Myotisia sp. PD_48]
MTLNQQQQPSRPGSPVSRASFISVSASISTFKVYETGDISASYARMKDVAVQVSMSEPPKRKPVPLPKDEKWVAPGPRIGGTFLPATWMQKLRYNWAHRRKRMIIIGVIVIVCLLALIIGLAVGLSRKGVVNLPLPTSNGGPYTGDLTYYDPELGACGIVSSGSENICAVSKDLYDAASRSSNPNENPLCGLKLRLKRDGKSVDVTVVDRCVGCKPTDIDVSRSVFNKLALAEQGRVLVEWAWLDKPPVKVPQ